MNDAESLVLALTAAAQEPEPAPNTSAPKEQDDLQDLFARQRFLQTQLSASKQRVTELEAELVGERNNQAEIQRQFAAIKEQVLRVFGIEQPVAGAVVTTTPTVPPSRR